MSYVKEAQKDTVYTSVNHLIQPKKYSGLSVMPPCPAQLQAIRGGTSEKPIQKQTNNTGLPDNLKTGVENISGFSMNDVRVHYNSSKPAQLQALAYTQGTDIHVAPGQERHLPHEAWHVVQQKQGRVQSTFQMKGPGMGVNDDPELEREADQIGKIASEQVIQYKRQSLLNIENSKHETIQCIKVTIAHQGGVDMFNTEKLSLDGLKDKLKLAIANNDTEAQQLIQSEIKYRETAHMEEVLKIVLKHSASEPKVYTQFRFISKNLKDFVDENFINPNTWAVLHSLRETSFKTLLKALGLSGLDYSGFTKTDSKYDPAKFGEYSSKHTWLKNLEWLKLISAKFDKVVLTALPLTLKKILREPEKIQHGPVVQFSALAREIAYLFTHDWIIKPEEVMLNGNVNVQKLVKTTGAIDKVVKSQTPILELVLNGDATKINPLVVLLTFRTLGVSCARESIQTEQAAVAEYTSGDVQELSKIISKYLEQKSLPKYSKLEGDPLQWPTGGLKEIIKEALGKATISDRDAKQWRQKLSMEYNKRGKKWQ